MRCLRLAWMAVAVSLLGSGCERSDNVSATPPESPRVQEFQAHGIVKSLRAPEGRVVIAHEEIRGYMPAMTMEFQTARAEELGGLEPGDVLDFRLVVTDRSSAIDHLKKIGHAAIPVDEVPGQPAVGTSIPDGAFTDEQGRAVRLSDFRGRVVGLTFIFTRCPLPDYCPRLSRQFAEAARALVADQPADRVHGASVGRPETQATTQAKGADNPSNNPTKGNGREGKEMERKEKEARASALINSAGSDARAKLVSVTMDPAFDTPAVLAEYARAFRPAEAAEHWCFLTGTPEEIRKLGRFCGLATKGQGSALEHNLRTVVLDREGKVACVFAGNEWTAQELVDAMRKAAE